MSDEIWDVPPNYSYWCKKLNWTLPEASQLLCEKDPENLPRYSNLNRRCFDDSDTMTSYAFLNLKDKASSVHEIHALFKEKFKKDSKMSPAQFLMHARQMGLEIPLQLERAANNLGILQDGKILIAQYSGEKIRWKIKEEVFELEGNAARVTRLLRAAKKNGCPLVHQSDILTGIGYKNNLGRPELRGLFRSGANKRGWKNLVISGPKKNGLYQLHSNAIEVAIEQIDVNS